jgi:hypothetical protein
MTCPLLLARLDAAEAQLARVSAASGGHGVEVLWREESARYDPHAVPDAFYVNRGDPYVTTQLYDVGRDEFVTVAWGDWLEAPLTLRPGAAHYRG